jgi:hypothetical protein
MAPHKKYDSSKTLAALINEVLDDLNQAFAAGDKECMNLLLFGTNLTLYLEKEFELVFQESFPEYAMQLHCHGAGDGHLELYFTFSANPKTSVLASLFKQRLEVYQQTIGIIECAIIDDCRYFKSLTPSPNSPAGKLSVAGMKKILDIAFLEDVKADAETITQVGKYLEQMPAERQLALAECAGGLFKPDKLRYSGVPLSSVADPAWRQNVVQEIEKLESSIH